VGVNEFQGEGGASEDILRIPPQVERYQKENLPRSRPNGTTEKVKERLALLKKVAQGTDNIMLPILDAVRSYATLGEISDT